MSAQSRSQRIDHTWGDIARTERLVLFCCKARGQRDAQEWRIQRTYSFPGTVSQGIAFRASCASHSTAAAISPRQSASRGGCATTVPDHIVTATPQSQIPCRKSFLTDARISRQADVSVKAEHVRARGKHRADEEHILARVEEPPGRIHVTVRSECAAQVFQGQVIAPEPAAHAFQIMAQAAPHVGS